MNRQDSYIRRLRVYRFDRRRKDFVRSWFFTADKTIPDLQFVRLNPEE